MSKKILLLGSVGGALVGIVALAGIVAAPTLFTDTEDGGKQQALMAPETGSAVSRAPEAAPTAEKVAVQKSASVSPEGGAVGVQAHSESRNAAEVPVSVQPAAAEQIAKAAQPFETARADREAPVDVRSDVDSAPESSGEDRSISTTVEDGGEAAPDDTVEADTAYSVGAIVAASDSDNIGVIKKVDATSGIVLMELSDDLKAQMIEDTDEVSVPMSWVAEIEGGLTVNMNGSELVQAMNLRIDEQDLMTDAKEK